MYVAYFVNTKTGQLCESHNPKKNPTGEDWQNVDEEEYSVMLAVYNYAKNYGRYAEILLK